MNKTKIEWCDSTWNPVTGCFHNCEYCYARRIANRFGTFETIDGNNIRILDTGSTLNCAEVKNRAKTPYPLKFTPTLHRYRLDEPQKWTAPRTIFVCSMADLFGDWIPNSWIEEVFDACRKAPQHRYLFLTKNYMRASEFRFEKNWWIGRTITHNEPMGGNDKNLYLCYGSPKSVESAWEAHQNKFVSIEPIQGFIPDLPFYAHKYGGYKWVIVGAETGNRKDKVIPKREWIERIVEDCDLRQIPLFMKDSLIPIMGEENMLREFPEGLRKDKEND